MAGDIQITGAEKLGRLASQLKASGDKETRRELYRGLQRAAKPLKEVAKEGAQDLPKSGGLAAYVASSKFAVRTRAGRNPAVRLTAKRSSTRGKPSQLGAMDEGRVRHPVYGHRNAWVVQSIRPGWWTRGLISAAPVVRVEMVKVLDAISAKLKG